MKAIAARGARRLIYSFLALPREERLRIAEELGLIQSGDDLSAPEFEIYQLIFSRAREAGLLDSLGEHIETAQPNKTQETEPPDPNVPHTQPVFDALHSEGMKEAVKVLN